MEKLEVLGPDQKSQTQNGWWTWTIRLTRVLIARRPKVHQNRRCLIWKSGQLDFLICEVERVLEMLPFSQRYHTSGDPLTSRTFLQRRLLWDVQIPSRRRWGMETLNDGERGHNFMMWNEHIMQLGKCKQKSSFFGGTKPQWKSQLAFFFDLQDLAFTARHQVSAKRDALVNSNSVVQVTEFSKPKQVFFLNNKGWTGSIFNDLFEAWFLRHLFM